MQKLILNPKVYSIYFYCNPQKKSNYRTMRHNCKTLLGLKCDMDMFLCDLTFKIKKPHKYDINLTKCSIRINVCICHLQVS